MRYLFSWIPIKELEHTTRQYPELFSYLTRVLAVGVEHSSVAPEPVGLNLHDAYKDDPDSPWLVIISYPGSVEDVDDRYARHTERPISTSAK